VRFDTTFINVFNHPNFYSIDAYVDDAGVKQEEYGFADPSLFSGGNRQIKFGLRVEF
jgi:tetrahydromethanopterin S-methyltransferase subunit F